MCFRAQDRVQVRDFTDLLCHDVLVTSTPATFQTNRSRYCVRGGNGGCSVREPGSLPNTAHKTRMENFDDVLVLLGGRDGGRTVIPNELIREFVQEETLCSLMFVA
jgi:hypothetical protein